MRAKSSRTEKKEIKQFIKELLARGFKPGEIVRIVNKVYDI